MQFTENQIKELEDTIFNALTPVYGYIDMYRGKRLPKKKADIMLIRLKIVKDYISKMRPESKRWNR